MGRVNPGGNGNGKRIHHGKPPRPRTRQGVYKRCRVGVLGIRSCPGVRETKNGIPYGHKRCGGDGWIKVADAKHPRRRGRNAGPRPTRRPGRYPRGTGRPKGTGQGRRRAAGSAAGAALAWTVADELFGAVGQVAVLALFGVLLALKGAAVGIEFVARFGVDHRAVAS